MPALTRLALPAALIIAALLIPTPVATETEQCTITVNLPELPAPIVNLTLDPDAPVVNITIPERSVTVTAPQPQVITETVEVIREISVDRIVEVEVEVEVLVICNPAIQPDRRAVILSDGVVTGIMAGNPGQQFTDFVEGNSNYVEITCLPVQPQVGWTYDGEVFAPPS
jgi:hypothetical protein